MHLEARKQLTVILEVEGVALVVDTCPKVESCR